MQGMTMIMVIALQLVIPGQDAALLDEITVTAPRYEYEDIAWCGMMDEMVVTAPRHTEAEIAQMETMPEVTVTAARYEPGVIPEDHPAYHLSAVDESSGYTFYDLWREFSLLPRLAHSQTIPDFDLDELEIDFKVKGGTNVAGDFTLPASDTIHDDVTVTGGSATIDGVVNGDVAVMGGEVIINGKVLGDVAVMGGNCDLTGTVDGDGAIFGGNLLHTGKITGDIFVVGGTITLDSAAVVSGDISMIGGAIDKHDAAIVEGDVTSIEAEAIHKFLPRISRIFRFPGHLPGIGVFPRLFFISMLIVIFVVTLLVMLIFPGTIEKIVAALYNNVWAAAGLGLALEVLYIPLIILFAISVIGIPLIPVFALVVFLAIVFGTGALSFVIGERVIQSFKWNITNKIGTFCIGWLTAMILPIVVFLIGPPIFILGFFIIYVIMTIGIGAVIWTLVRKKEPAVKK
jgi:cytoskeletal protein CcmA (bactofilin family)